MFSVVAWLGMRKFEFSDDSQLSNYDTTLSITSDGEPWELLQAWMNYDRKSGKYFIEFINANGYREEHELGVEAP